MVMIANVLDGLTGDTYCSVLSVCKHVRTN